MNDLMKILRDIRPDVDFDGNDKLIDDGILDSLDIVALVTELNDFFDIDISVEHLVPENFNSPQSMMQLIDNIQD